MTTRTSQTAATSELTATEQQTLSALRAHYAESQDVFSRKELNLLRFLRWLVCTGRLEP
jgi:hypothetical protein